MQINPNIPGGTTHLNFTFPEHGGSQFYKLDSCGWHYYSYTRNQWVISNMNQSFYNMLTEQ